MYRYMHIYIYIYIYNEALYFRIPAGGIGTLLSWLRWSSRAQVLGSGSRGVVRKHRTLNDWYSYHLHGATTDTTYNHMFHANE